MAVWDRTSRLDDMRTTESMVLPSPLAWAPLPVPPRRRWVWLVLPVVVVVVALMAAATVTLPYYAISPGSARQVNDLIKVPQDRNFPPRGRVLLATVLLSRATVLEAVQGWLDPDITVVPQEQILGSTPPKQFNRVNLQIMDESKQVAVVVALRRLGYQVGEHGKGALIVGVEPGSPAAGRLAAGEIVTAIDGRPTSLSDQLVAAIRSHKPGDTVRLDVVPAGGGASRVEQLVLGTHPKRSGGFLGVSVQTRERRFDFPFEVTIDSAGIGGPSAGLAFTLGVLDTLSQGELTGGTNIAVTGTIEIDGTVGDVGGVAQKTAAVRSAGATYFLVPPGEYDEARAHAGSKLRVIKVATLDEAIAALGRVGGDVSALGAPRRPSQG